MRHKNVKKLYTYLKKRLHASVRYNYYFQRDSRALHECVHIVSVVHTCNNVRWLCF